MKRTKASAFFIGACVLVATGLVLAFLTIGTPAHNREIELDAKRIEGLDEMGTSIRTRYGEGGRLPKALPSDFEANPYLRREFDDPETGRRYEYRRIDDDRFQLCADFSAPSDSEGDDHPRASSMSWPHPAGFFCKAYSTRRGLASPN
ncbi:MAG: hypothetical protein IAI49_05725 [Candidatus Eremiobacteraeota bacterium]|nr:hypothetical protein [Candidatus Eremiobacteraeota bacterium]